MLRRFFTTLGIRDFRALVLSATTSQLGDRLTHMLLITLIATARPGRLLGYSEGSLAFTLPTLLLTPIVGVLVDRWDKRTVIAVTHFIQSGILFSTPLLIALTGSFLPFWIAVAFFFGLDLFNNTANPALLPRLVGQDRILAANSVSLTFSRVATVLGMLVGGFLIRWVGWRLGLAIDAATHLGAGLIALSILTRMRREVRVPLRGELGRALVAFGRDLRELLLLLGRNRVVAFVLGSIIVSTFISAVSYTILIFLVQQQLGLGTAGVGVFSAIVAVGMIAGAVSLSAVPQGIDRPRVVVAAIFAYGLMFLIGYWHVSIPFLVIIAIVAGAAFSWLGVVQTTILQEEVAAEIRGRIFSTREFVTNLTFIATTVLIGAIGDLTSHRLVMPLIGGVLLTVAVAAYLFSRNLRPARSG